MRERRAARTSFVGVAPVRRQLVQRAAVGLAVLALLVALVPTTRLFVQLQSGSAAAGRPASGGEIARCFDGVPIVGTATDFDPRASEIVGAFLACADPERGTATFSNRTPVVWRLEPSGDDGGVDSRIAGSAVISPYPESRLTRMAAAELSETLVLPPYSSVTVPLEPGSPFGSLGQWTPSAQLTRVYLSVGLLLGAQETARTDAGIPFGVGRSPTIEASVVACAASVGQQSIDAPLDAPFDESALGATVAAAGLGDACGMAWTRATVQAEFDGYVMPPLTSVVTAVADGGLVAVEESAAAAARWFAYSATFVWRT